MGILGQVTNNMKKEISYYALVDENGDFLHLLDTRSYAGKTFRITPVSIYMGKQDAERMQRYLKEAHKADTRVIKINLNYEVPQLPEEGN